MRNQRTALIVVSILLILSVVGNVVLMFRSSRLADERDVARGEVTVGTQRIAELTAETQAQEATIQTLRREKAELETQLTAELEGRDARVAQLSRQVSSLTRETTALREEVANRDELLLTLQAENVELKDELDLSRNLLEEGHEFQAALADSISAARPLRAYNINTLTKWDRWLCADRYNVDRARRVDETQVTFEVAGTVFSREGAREVHLVMVTPEGEVINQPGQTFTNRETGEQEAYTQMRTINYAREPERISFTVQHDERLAPGVYQMQVFIDGRLARMGTMRLE
jgi:hypothetical protein